VIKPRAMGGSLESINATQRKEYVAPSVQKLKKIKGSSRCASSPLGADAGAASAMGRSHAIDSAPALIEKKN